MARRTTSWSRAGPSPRSASRTSKAGTTPPIAGGYRSWRRTRAGSGAAPEVGAISPSDVLVVGAGPGGSNAARVALDAGLSVVQIEAQRFPRAKPCAGGITRKAERALALDIRPSLRGTSDTIEFNSW